MSTDNFWTKIRKLYRSVVPKQTQPIRRPYPMSIPNTRPDQRPPVSNQPAYPTPDQEDGALNAKTKYAMLCKAGQQQLMVEMLYDSQSRLVEPYSFREKSTGRLFYGFCSIHGKIHSFRLEKIESLKLTNIRYSPRWPIEL